MQLSKEYFTKMGHMLASFVSLLVIIALFIVVCIFFVPFVKSIYETQHPTEANKEMTTFQSQELAERLAKNKQDWFKPGVLANAEHKVNNIQQVPTQGGWINTTPLDFSELAASGHLVYIYFWSYASLESLISLNYLQNLWQNYKNNGLVIVAVHSPILSIEKDPALINAAAKANAVTFPILLDGEHKLWTKFGVRIRPTEFLVDSHGQIIFNNFGSGAYALQENAIRQALQKAGWSLPPKLTDKQKFLHIARLPVTPTLYAGPALKRRQFGNVEQPQNKKITTYTLPKEILPNVLYVSGTWAARHDYIESKTPAQIIVKFQANKVMLTASATPAQKLSISLDEESLNSVEAGKDIKNNNEVEISEPRLYDIVAMKSDEQHLLTISVPAGVRFYNLQFANLVRSN